MSLKFAIPPSRLRNGWCEFLALLLGHRPHSWSAALPVTVIAARYDRSSINLVAGARNRRCLHLDYAEL